MKIDGDIRRASTLPGSFYSDPDLFRRSQDLIFASSWQLAGTVENVRVPGQVFPFTLLEGMLDEPLVLTRDSSDGVRCLSNVCTHRANLVVENAGVERHLRCRYHGRRFSLDGRFHSMPEFEEAECFPTSGDDLPELPLERWEGFYFVSLDPAFSFQEWMAAMSQRIGWLPVGEARFDASRSRDYLVQAHWALYCDNYLEGFHIPFVHSALAETLDYGSYTTELYPWSSLQIGVAKDGEEAFDLPPSSPDYGQRIAAYYYWLFPNLMFNFYPWGLSVNEVKPLGPARTRIRFLSYVWDQAKLERGAGSLLDRVEREDEAVVESVQRGVRSRLYRRGRFSPSREQGVHHFHRLLAGRLA